MTFAGVQKMSMLDFPGKLCATVFTAGCNMLCPFCHNASLVLGSGGEELAQEELLAFLGKRRGLLDGVCVTGGEPLLQADVAEFIREVRALGFAVKLDTNGTLPERLRPLVENGEVDYVAMDIKNSLAKYAPTVGKERFDTAPIEESVKILMNGGVPYEFRTTVVKGLHTARDIEDIGIWLRGAERYFLQAFVDSGDLISPGFQAFSAEEMRAMANGVKDCFGSVEVRGI